MYSAAILNGGRARRMAGQDKAWVSVDGQPIVHRQLAVLQQRFSPIAMVVGERGHAKALPVAILADRIGGQGPVDGIAAALSWSPTEWILIVASDMPNLNLAIIDALLDAISPEADVIACESEGRVQPLFALYHRKSLPAIDAFLQAGHRKASQVLTELGLQVTWVSARKIAEHHRAFANLNRPEDLS